MLNIPEILIILVVVIIIFGVGKVGNIGMHLGKAKKEFKKGLEGKDSGSKQEFIDITPSDEEDPDYNPKPGTRPQPVEDAELDAPGNSSTK